MRRIVTAAVLSLAGAGLATAGPVQVESPYSVEKTVANLTDAVEAAGAKVFAVVPHSEGAARVDMELAPMTLVIFGNPEVGTAALQAAPLAGLALPMRVLAYEDADGQVRLAYEDPEAMLTARGVPADAPVIGRIGKALKRLTGRAVAE